MVAILPLVSLGHHGYNTLIHNIAKIKQKYRIHTDTGRKSKHHHYCHHHCPPPLQAAQHHAAQVAIPLQSARVFEPNAARFFGFLAHENISTSGHDALRMRILLHFKTMASKTIRKPKAIQKPSEPIQTISNLSLPVCHSTLHLGSHELLLAEVCKALEAEEILLIKAFKAPMNREWCPCALVTLSQSTITAPVWCKLSKSL